MTLADTIAKGLTKFVSPATAKRKARVLAAAPCSTFEKLTPKELKKLGLSPKSERYILVGESLRASNTISKREYLQKRTGELAGERLTLEQAAVRRKNEDLAYSSRAAENQAAKQRETRFRKRLSKDALTVKVKDHRGRTYQPAQYFRTDYLQLRDRKLAGEEFEQGDYFALLNMAEALNDPALPLLKQSPEVLRYG